MKTDLAVLSTLVIAFCLSVVAMPDWAMLARPELPMMVLCYWIMAMPERYGIAVAALVGLFYDGVVGTHLGVHGLSYAVAGAAMSLSYQQIRMYGAWKQALAVGILLLLTRWLELMVMGLIMPVNFSVAALFLPVVSGILVWPWLMLFLRGLRRKLGIVNRFP